MADAKAQTINGSVFQDSFASGNFSAWSGNLRSGTGTASVETLNPYVGTYNAKYANVNSGYKAMSYKTGLTSSPIMYVKSHYKFATLPTQSGPYAGGLILGGCGASGADAVFAGLGRANGHTSWSLYVYNRGVESYFQEATPSDPVIGTYYAVKVMRDVTNGKVALWINNVLKISRSMTLANSNTIVWGGIVFQNGCATSQTCYLGDVDAKNIDMDMLANQAVSSTPTTLPARTGEVFLLLTQWLSNSDGTPNAIARRIAAAIKAYGNPTWVDVGNWGWRRTDWLYPHWTRALVDFFHAAGIKTCCQIPADTNNPAHPITFAQVKAEIDYQMKLCSNIDGFFFDSVAGFWDGKNIAGGARAVDPYAWNMQVQIRDYVHGLGKIVMINVGTKNVHRDCLQLADVICLEASWKNFVIDHPDYLGKGVKFMGLENNYDPISVRNFGTINLNTAVANTKQAWSIGIYYFQALETLFALPWWWETHLSQLS